MQIRRLSGVLGTLTLFLGLGGLTTPAAEAQAVSSTPSQSVSFNGAVTAIVKKGSTAYVVGSFTQALDSSGTHRRRHLAAVDLSTGRLLPWHTSGTNGTPSAIARYRNQLFVGGDFTTSGKVKVHGLTRISARTGRVSRRFHPRVHGGQILALTTTKRAVYLGGDFTRVDGGQRSRLAAVTRKAGALERWRPQADRQVWTLAFHGGRIYAGGEFNHIHGAPRPDLVALRPGGAGRVVGAFHPQGEFPVKDLAFTKTAVAVAEAGPGGRLSVLAPSGQRLWRETFDGDAQAVTILGDHIYVGGHWMFICATPVVVHANGDCVDGGTRQPRLASYTLGGQRTDWAPNPDSSEGVLAMATASQRLAVGGDFDHFLGGTVTQPKFAEFRP